MANVPIIQYTNYNALLNALLPTTQSGTAVATAITNSYNTTVSDVATLNSLTVTVPNPLLGGMG